MATYRPDSNTLLKSDSILEYVLETMVYPREHERMRELRLITQQHPEGFMGSSPDQMQFFSMLLKMIGAKNTLEVGVFTGYSLLVTALSLPDDDGKVVAVDASREYYELGRPVIERAGVAHKVDFREGDGIAVLDRMLLDHHAAGEEGLFDFAYVEADKQRLPGYHERVLRLVRVGGVVAYDNTLWGGSMAVPRDMPGSSEFDRVVRDFVVEFNAAVAADDRVEACLLSIADGVTLCRRAPSTPSAVLARDRSDPGPQHGRRHGQSCSRLVGTAAPGRSKRHACNLGSDAAVRWPELQLADARIACARPRPRHTQAPALGCSSERRRRGDGRRRRGEEHPPRGHHQDAPQERSPLRVHAEHDGLPTGARVPARAPPHHPEPHLWVHVVATRRGAAAVDAAQADGRQEHRRGRRVHRLLRPRHRARHPRGRQGRGDRRQPGVLRPRPARHPEGRRRAQGRLPRGTCAAHPRRIARRWRERGDDRLRVRGRGQGQLRQLPRAAAPPGARRRRARLRQHALGRHRGDAGRRAANGGRPGDQGLHQGLQRQDRRGPARRGRADPDRRRHHAVPPHLLSGRLSTCRATEE